VAPVVPTNLTTNLKQPGRMGLANNAGLFRGITEALPA